MQLSTRQVAEMLGIHESTLKNWRTETPPFGPDFTKIGAKVVYTREAVIDWLALRTRDGSSRRNTEVAA